MQTFFILVVTLLSACGNHAAVSADSVQASRQQDGTVALDVAVKSTGTNPWPKGSNYCVISEWKETSLLPAAPAEGIEYYSPLATIANVDRTSACFEDGIAVGKVVVYRLTSTKILPEAGLTIVTHVEIDPDEKPSQTAGTKIVRDDVVRTTSP